MQLKIDGQTVEAQEGELLLQVALRNDIEIPHFCYHPCLSAAGNCRICLVKVEGQPKLVPSCNLTVADGMEVSSDCLEVHDARKDVMQFILLNHPADCGVCDKAGECRLQDYQVRYGEVEPLALEKRPGKPKFYDLSPRLLLDSDRCILCSRCVRFTHEVSGSKQLGIVERGCHSQVQRLEDNSFDDPYSDNVVTTCPVGALLSKDFLYQSRVWYLEPVRSVCTGCARCCSVNVWRRKREWQVNLLDPELNRKVYRTTPLENAQVNGPWLCNKGFDLHKLMTRERVQTPRVRAFNASKDDMFRVAKELIGNANRPAAIVSAHASNEELLVFKETLGNKVTVYTREDHSCAEGEVVEDDFLICSDKNPNKHGMEQLFGHNPYDPDADHDLVVVWGDNVDYVDFKGVPVIHLAAFASGREEQAAIFVPISTIFERSGTFTNFAGVENRFEQVFEKPDTVLHAEHFFRRLGE